MCQSRNFFQCRRFPYWWCLSTGVPRSWGSSATDWVSGTPCDPGGLGSGEQDLSRIDWRDDRWPICVVPRVFGRDPLLGSSGRTCRSGPMYSRVFIILVAVAIYASGLLWLYRLRRACRLWEPASSANVGSSGLPNRLRCLFVRSVFPNFMQGALCIVTMSCIAGSAIAIAMVDGGAIAIVTAALLLVPVVVQADALGRSPHRFFQRQWYFWCGSKQICPRCYHPLVLQSGLCPECGFVVMRT